jgi:hypothetical protein
VKAAFWERVQVGVGAACLTVLEKALAREGVHGELEPVSDVFECAASGFLPLSEGVCVYCVALSHLRSVHEHL